MQLLWLINLMAVTALSETVHNPSPPSDSSSSADWFERVDRSHGESVSHKFPGIEDIRHILHKKAGHIGPACNLKRLKEFAGNCVVAAHQGMDGLGARASRMLVTKLLAATFDCRSDCPSFQNLAQHSTVMMQKIKNSYYCHRKGNGTQFNHLDFAAVSKTQDPRRWGEWWNTLRCYDSDVNSWLHSWMCPAEEPKSDAYKCAFHQRPTVHFNRLTNVQIRAMQKELESIRKTYRRKRITSSLLRQCGYTESNLDVAVHIRLGDQGFRFENDSTVPLDRSLKALPALQSLFLSAIRAPSSTFSEVQFHIFTETTHLQPEWTGSRFIFPDIGKELQIRSDHSGNKRQTQFLADLRLKNGRVQPVHVVNNADPVWSLECLAASDVLLLADSSFSNEAAALSTNLKLFFGPQEKWQNVKDPRERNLKETTREWIMTVDDNGATRRRPYDLWHPLNDHSEPRNVGVLNKSLQAGMLIEQPIRLKDPKSEQEKNFETHYRSVQGQ